MIHKQEKAGLVAHPQIAPSDSSVKRYKMLLAAAGENVSIQETAVKKTQTRFTAENSFISGLAFALVTAATHFNLGENRYFRKNIFPKLSSGSKLLISLLEGYYKVPVYPIKPKYVINIDDTVDYIFVGTEGFFMVKMPGLCIGGLNTNGFGYLLFIRENAENKDCRRSLIHRRHVLQPFLDKLRQEDGWMPRDPVPYHLRAVVCESP